MTPRPPIGGSPSPFGRRPSRMPTIVAVVSVLLVAVVVIGGVLYFGSKPSDPIQAAPVAASYQTTVQNGVIVAGRGPTQIDVYEDALCPVCKAFEAQDGQKITQGLNDGRFTVRYHMVNLLENSSNPPGYSTLGGNAIICAAANNAFAGLFQALYAQQPEEGGAGYTVDQLVDAGRQVNAGPGYEACVRGGTYSAAVAANYQQASSTPALQQTTSSGQTGFGTPTVVLNGRTVDWQGPELAAALA